jgi:hypothetical protein
MKSSPKLSVAQLFLLAEVASGPTTQIRAQMLLRSWRKTASRLEALDLIVFRPYALQRKGAYYLTSYGHQIVEAFLADGSLSRE